MTQASNSASHLFLGIEGWDFVPLTPREPFLLVTDPDGTVRRVTGAALIAAVRTAPAG